MMIETAVQVLNNRSTHDSVNKTNFADDII